MKEKKNKTNILKKIFFYLLFIIFLFTLIYSGYKIYIWDLDNKRTKELTEEIKKIAKPIPNTSEGELVNPPQETKQESDYWYYTSLPFYEVDFTKLKEKNSDTIAFIHMPETNINYPVVQTNNNDFYLTHSFDKSYNKAGWIFADYINKNLKNNELDKNTIIYGHNRQNNSMFGTLSNVFKEEWLSNKENHYINFSTLNNNMVWEVFSTYTIEKEEYYIQSNFSSDEEYISFLNTIKNRSTYKYDVNISKEDKILTLSTCYNNDDKVVVHAKLIKRESK